jgi:hypothetical protein
MRCWRRMMKIIWTDHVRNEDVLYRVKEERNILHTTKRRKATWICHVLRRICLLKHAIEGQLEGRTEMTWRRGRRRKHLLDDPKEKISYWKLKEEAWDCTLWRTCFGRSKELVGRQTAEWIKWMCCGLLVSCTENMHFLFLYSNIFYYYGVCVGCTCLTICQRINRMQVQLSLKDSRKKQIIAWDIHDFF